MSEADKDAEILFPDQTLEVGGEQVTVREFRFLEGARAAVIARDLLADLGQLVQQEQDLQPEDIDAIIGQHGEAWAQLLAMSIDRDPEWVANLSDEDGQELSMLFWDVNGPFFVRRLVQAVDIRHEMETRLSQPPSSLPH